MVAVATWKWYVRGGLSEPYSVHFILPLRIYSDILSENINQHLSGTPWVF